jgi:hypothetical protein
MVGGNKTGGKTKDGTVQFGEREDSLYSSGQQKNCFHGTEY